MEQEWSSAPSLEELPMEFRNSEFRSARKPRYLPGSRTLSSSSQLIRPIPLKLPPPIMSSTVDQEREESEITPPSFRKFPSQPKRRTKQIDIIENDVQQQPERSNDISRWSKKMRDRAMRKISSEPDIPVLEKSHRTSRRDDDFETEPTEEEPEVEEDNSTYSTSSFSANVADNAQIESDFTPFSLRSKPASSSTSKSRKRNVFHLNDEDESVVEAPDAVATTSQDPRVINLVSPEKPARKEHSSKSARRSKTHNSPMSSRSRSDSEPLSRRNRSGHPNYHSSTAPRSNFQDPPAASWGEIPIDLNNESSEEGEADEAFAKRMQQREVFLMNRHHSHPPPRSNNHQAHPFSAPVSFFSAPHLGSAAPHAHDPDYQYAMELQNQEARNAQRSHEILLSAMGIGFGGLIQNLGRGRGRGSRPVDADLLRLSLLNREFNENDYEMLLKLDESIENKKGADKKTIESLPVQVVDELDEETEPTQCVICLETIESGDMIRELPCHHSFHVDCIDPWLKVNRCCPIDKKSILE